MSWTEAGILAGSVSTVLFVASYLPMLHKVVRSRDLTSYSLGNLVIANVGNGVHTVYVLSLPPGPLWALHAFYLGSSALMLLWWWRFRAGERVPTDTDRHAAAATGEELTCAMTSEVLGRSLDGTEDGSGFSRTR